MAYDGPGDYRHWKGGLYRVIGLECPEEHKVEALRDLDPDLLRVVYWPLTPGSMLESVPMVGLLGRKLSDFNADVHIPGDPNPDLTVPRFRLENP